MSFSFRISFLIPQKLLAQSDKSTHARLLFFRLYQEMNLQFLLEGLSNVDFQAWWRQQSFFFWFALCPSVTRLTDVTCRYHYLRNSYYENSNFFPKKNCLFLKWNLWNHADIWRNSKRKRRGRKVTGFLALYNPLKHFY